ncbi:hypothetical protein PQJ75_20035 [Rhodoplanes sp. TEM]|uniref:Uncharacterized protein n=1 Tax=Rhodoplanes tepidamans TaxID=200616 RepID=A0ABT5JJ12_RHOTP|nr:MULTISPECIES: hypothetical protein [Rhodoplanes]MDC7789336.1 hypothetical protein [Rhodoplanes tepidamans]MDC7986025.1 hypothetical protein [Rhodoplanes sp. TEM]MDQ0358985.1 hypothetical protein [Rhodoplanes tepidamans]
MVMLVALSNTHVPIVATALTAEFRSVFPRHFLTSGDDGSFVAAGPLDGLQVFAKSLVPGASGFFMVQSVPGPYSDVSKAPGRIGDPAMRERALAQTCWLSVELVHTWASPEDARRFIARTMARLAPDDTAVLLRPPDGAVAFDAAVRARLAAGETVC